MWISNARCIGELSEQNMIWKDLLESCVHREAFEDKLWLCRWVRTAQHQDKEKDFSFD